MSDEQIQKPVVVVITPRDPGGICVRGANDLIGDLSKRAAALVVIEQASGTRAGDNKIEAAIVVIISPGRTR